MHPDSRPELYDYLLDRTMLVETKETRKVRGREVSDVYVCRCSGHPGMTKLSQIDW